MGIFRKHIDKCSYGSSVSSLDRVSKAAHSELPVGLWGRKQQHKQLPICHHQYLNSLSRDCFNWSEMEPGGQYFILKHLIY